MTEVEQMDSSAQVDPYEKQQPPDHTSSEVLENISGLDVSLVFNVVCLE